MMQKVVAVKVDLSFEVVVLLVQIHLVFLEVVAEVSHHCHLVVEQVKALLDLKVEVVMAYHLLLVEEVVAQRIYLEVVEGQHCSH